MSFETSSASATRLRGNLRPGEVAMGAMRTVLMGVVAIAAMSGGADLGPAQAQSVSRLAESQSTASIEDGRRLAELDCSNCHAIGRRGDSPNSMAPPFRRLSRTYSIDSLDEAFAEGVFMGHSNMPQFQFTPDQIEALTAYLKSIQDAPHRSQPP